MATVPGIWLGQPAAADPVGYEDVQTSLVDLGATVTQVQTSVLNFIAQQAAGGSGGPATFATLTGNPADNTALAQALVSVIDDALTTSSTKSHSITKTRALIAAQADQTKTEILTSAGSTYDALQSVKTELANNSSASTAILAALGLRVRVDAAQSLTGSQQAQATTNLGLDARLLPPNPTVGKTVVFTANGWVLTDLPTGTTAPPVVVTDPEELLDVAAVQAVSAITSAVALRTTSLRTSNGL